MRDSGGTDKDDWTPVGSGIRKYAIRKAPYTIAKYLTPIAKYGLWKDGEEKCLGYFETAAEAKERAAGN